MCNGRHGDRHRRDAYIDGKVCPCCANRPATTGTMVIDDAITRSHIRAERFRRDDAAQRDADQLAKGGQPYQSTGSRQDPVEKPITLAEVGIDKHLADRARKLALIVMEAKGLDTSDKLVRKAAALSLVNVLGMGHKRGHIGAAGMRKGVRVWSAPNN